MTRDCPRCGKSCHREPAAGMLTCFNCGARWRAVAETPVPAVSAAMTALELVAALRWREATLREMTIHPDGGGVIVLAAAGVEITHGAKTDEQLFLGAVAKLDKAVAAALEVDAAAAAEAAKR